MTDSEQHPYVEWIAREARRPVVSDQGMRDRVMAAVHAEPPPSRDAGWGRVFEPRVFNLSPIGTTLSPRASSASVSLPARSAITGTAGRSGNLRLLLFRNSRFLIRSCSFAPQANHVSVVGDFNGWDATKNPLARSGDSGLWSVKLPLAAGRHVYAFVVDGSWNRDPGAPVAPDDGFGQAKSVRIVALGAAL